MEDATSTSETTDEKTDEITDRAVIRAGRDFETEYRLSAEEAGEFLVKLGTQLKEGSELTIVDEEWELPFAFGEPIGVEIDYEGVSEEMLEIEIEIPGATDERAPDVV